MKQIHVLIGMALCFGLLLSTPVLAQGDITVAWNRTFGKSTANDSAWSLVAVPGTTDVIFAGETASYGAGDADGWAVRIDGNGTQVWNRKFGKNQSDTAHAIANTSLTNFTLVGNLTPPLQTGPLQTDAWAIGLNQSGGRLWLTFLDGMNDSAVAYAVTAAGNGSSVVAGTTAQPGAADTDAFVVFLDPSGRMQRARAFGESGARDAAYSIVSDPRGGCLVAGSTQSFGSADTDAWVLRLDENGTEEWNQSYGGMGEDVARSIVRTADGNFIFAGSIVENTDTNALVVKIAPNGSVLWNYTYGEARINESANAIVQTRDGGYLFAGESGTNASKDTNAWLVKIDSAGQPEWSYTLGGRNPGDRANAVLQVGPTSYIFAGIFNRTVQKAPNDDAWVVKIDLAEKPGVPRPPAVKPKVSTPGNTKPGSRGIQTGGGGGVCTCSADFAVVTPKDDRTVNASIEFLGVVATGPGCSKGAKPTRWDWDFGDGSTGTGKNPTHAFRENGTYTVTVRVTLSSGTVCEGRRSVTIGDGVVQPPCECSVNFTVPEGVHFVWDWIPFSGTITRGPYCNQSLPGELLWDLDGDGVIDRYGLNPRYRFDEPGDYPVTVWGRLMDGTICPPFTDNITIICPCQLAIYYSTYDGYLPVVGEAVAFEGYNYGCSADSITGWAWDFGDGSTSSEESPTHTYNAAGTYTVTLQATLSDQRTCEATEWVTVREQGSLNITECMVIDRPGSYEVRQDIMDSNASVCIQVDDRTYGGVIIEGNGHTIDGTDQQGSIGIDVDRGGATIRNLKLSDWDVGVQSSVDDIVVETSSLTSNRAGVRLLDVWGRLDGNTITDNGIGVSLVNVGGVPVVHNRIENNEYGISIEYPTLWGGNNRIYNNLLNNPTNMGGGGFAEDPHDLINTLNLPTLIPGTNIVGGEYIGGNCWMHPDGTGFSQTCADQDQNGICDQPYSFLVLSSDPDSTNIDEYPLKSSGGTRDANSTLGDFVWNDTDGNGLQDAGEMGLANATVQLRDANGTVQNTTQTDAEGAYAFRGLTAGNYTLQFILPEGTNFTLADQGSDDALDSDADPATGLTANITLGANETQIDWDAGANGTIERVCNCTADFTWTPQPAIVNASVDFSAVVNTTGACNLSGRILNWTFGDNSTGTGEAVSHTYTAPGNYTVELDATFENETACMATQEVQVVEEQPPGVCNCTVNLTWAPESPHAAEEVEFNATTSIDGGCTVSTWSWQFGDGATSTAERPTHTYNESGSYTVNLTATLDDGGTCSDNRTIEVGAGGPIEPLEADFSADPTNGSAPLTVQFTDLSSGSPTGWAWDFDNDGSVDSADRSPSYTYAAAGTYTVSLDVTNGTASDGAVKENYIRVTEAAAPLDASFTAEPQSGPAPLTVRFTDTSTGNPLSWAWDFGDGNTSADQNPGHTYGSSGTYTATLTVSGSGGGTDTASRTIDVTAPPAIETTTPAETTPLETLTPEPSPPTEEPGGETPSNGNSSGSP